MSSRRVVVTGMGIISPVGNDLETAWQQVVAGQSGIGPITDFDVSEFPTRFGGNIRDFDASQYMPAKDLKKMDPFMQFGIAAASQAVAHAGLSDSSYSPDRIGVAIGSGIGGLGTIELNHVRLKEGGPRKISPFFVPASIINMISGHVSINYGYRGPNISLVSACTTATHSIGMAARIIVHGDADVMLAGGAEHGITPLGLGGFCAARALSQRNDDPAAASRPWDKDRDGFVLSDGAACLVLEEFESARKRGARIFAEVTGFGMSADAHHITAPPENGEGAQACMAAALKDARLNPDQIDYINAHGTSTPLGDIAESRAVRGLFGAHANKIAVSSTKSTTGHLLGAAGAVEAVFCVLAIRDQVAPPTINIDTVDPECDLDYVPNTARQMTINSTLSNSFGFGGTNGSLIFRRI
ncbi:MAG: beta-ketoacyl-ACP synthase II [Gammaproteobacteria bacterium]|nr:beta-ketoacyl-ACP synthase II [Gammaproteobacteria bacterium]MDH5275430.1 beta-ketoacyl-ACP synthase II [Gammaproteobacteria bacterium]